MAFLSPGKSYPGETNPRWALYLVWNRKGRLVHTKPDSDAVAAEDAIGVFEKKLVDELQIEDRWLDARDPSGVSSFIRVLALDHDGGQWITNAWPLNGGENLTLVGAEGAAGLRLPLNSLPPNAVRRALVLESKDDGLHIFFPPLLQDAFLDLLAIITANLRAAGIGSYFLEGYLPHDDAGIWSKLCLSPDPGVLEVNLPPCATAREYGSWMGALAASTAAPACALSNNIRAMRSPARAAGIISSSEARVSMRMRYSSGPAGSLRFSDTGSIIRRCRISSAATMWAVLAGPAARRILARALRPGDGLPVS